MREAFGSVSDGTALQFDGHHHGGRRTVDSERPEALVPLTWVKARIACRVNTREWVQAMKSVL